MEAIRSITKCSHIFPFRKREKKDFLNFFYNSCGDLREKKDSWKFLIWNPWQPDFILFNSKLGWIFMRFLGQTTYGFESWEFKNPRLQTDRNSELKQGSYSQLKQGYIKSMSEQWHWLQLKIRATSREIVGVNYIWFWSLGSHKSKTSNGSQFRVETREIWFIEARLRKRHAITRLSYGQIVFSCLGLFLGSFHGIWARWVFLFSLTLSLVIGLFW